MLGLPFEILLGSGQAVHAPSYITWYTGSCCGTKLFKDRPSSSSTIHIDISVAMAQLAAFRIPNIENEPNVRCERRPRRSSDDSLNSDSNTMSLDLLHERLYELL